MLPLLGAGPLQGPPILVTQQEQTAFPAEGARPDTMNVLAPPRLMGLGAAMGGPPILVTQVNYSPIEAIIAVESPITHPLMKFRIGRRGPALLTQQAQSQAGPRTFVTVPAGTLTTSAALARAISTTVSGALTTVGAMVRGVQIIKQGVLATASAVAKAVAAKVSGVLAISSTLAPGKTIKGTVTGSLTMAGTVTAVTVAPAAVVVPPQVFASPSDTLGVSATTVPWDGVTHGDGDVGAS